MNRQLLRSVPVAALCLTLSQCAAPEPSNPATELPKGQSGVQSGSTAGTPREPTNTCPAIKRSNLRNPQFNSQLAQAVENADTVVAKGLIEKGADVDVRRSQGWTALMTAAFASSVPAQAEMTQLLLSSGANVNAKGKYGETALTLAAGDGTPTTVRLLIDCGADVRARTSDGDTALMSAAWYGRAETVRILIAAGAEVNAASEIGLTPLLQAACSPRMDLAIVRQLLTAGANVNVETTDSRGLTPLRCAQTNGSLELQQLLQKTGSAQQTVRGSP